VIDDPMTDTTAPRQSFADKHRKILLGVLAVAIFFAAWQAVFLFVSFNPLFISKPDLILQALGQLLAGGDMLRDLAISAVPFLYGFAAAVLVGVPLGVVMGWRTRVGWALDPLMTVFYASPLVALSPLIVMVKRLLLPGTHTLVTVSVAGRTGFRVFVNVHVAAPPAATVMEPSVAQSPPMTVV